MKIIPPSADRSENPLLRGYWTDDDLLTWTGAGSVAVIKNMQREHLLTPRLERSESGQNARAWSVADVLRVAVVVDLVKETGFNLSVCAVLLGMIGRKALDTANSSALIAESVSEVLREPRSRRRSQQALPAILETARPDLVQLAVVDRTLIYACERGDEAQAFKSSCVGKLINVSANPPEVSPIVRQAPRLMLGNLESERSVLRVKLANLAEHSLQLLRSHLHDASAVLAREDRRRE